MKLSSKRRTKENEWTSGSGSDVLNNLKKKQPSKYWRLKRRREEEGGGKLFKLIKGENFSNVWRDLHIQV